MEWMSEGLNALDFSGPSFLTGCLILFLDFSCPATLFCGGKIVACPLSGSYVRAALSF